MNGKSNMYEWVTRKRNFIGGECPHQCSYCYVNNFKKKYPALEKRYTGKLFLIEKELTKCEGKEQVVFIQDMGDLFAENVPKEWIIRVLEHCRDYPNNTYLFQTKNPKRLLDFIPMFPVNSILGTTIETNRLYNGISQAPSMTERATAMVGLKKFEFKRMVNIEPIMDFDLIPFVEMLRQINPTFISIGADSKNCELPEPDSEKLEKLIDTLRKFVGVKIKTNLKKILASYENPDLEELKEEIDRLWKV